MKPMDTPWGKPNNIYPLGGQKAPIYFVSTPSHGGVMAEAEWAESALTPECIQAATFANFAGWVCWEEDCDATVPMFELWPHQFQGFSVEIEALKESITRWNPQYFLSSPDMFDFDLLEQVLSDNKSITPFHHPPQLRNAGDPLDKEPYWAILRQKQAQIAQNAWKEAQEALKYTDFAPNLLNREPKKGKFTLILFADLYDATSENGGEFLNSDTESMIFTFNRHRDLSKIVNLLETVKKSGRKWNYSDFIPNFDEILGEIWPWSAKLADLDTENDWKQAILTDFELLFETESGHEFCLKKRNSSD